MANKLLFTIVCDDVRIEQSQKILIVGLYNRTINFRLPPQQLPAPPKLVLPQLCIFRRWLIDTPGVIVRTTLIDPNLNATQLNNVALQVPDDGAYFQDVTVMPGLVLEPGEYTIRSDWGSGQHDEPFVVRPA